MSWEHIILVLITGVVCGIINTLAGSGSLISLPILMFIGLPPHVANGTNRIGILFQNIVSTWNFKRQKVLDVKMGWKVAIPSILGSVAGAFIVLELDDRAVEITVGVVLFIMLVPIFLKPRKWLQGSSPEEMSPNLILRFLIFLFIGAYGGFIQAGVGIFLLSALVLNAGYDLVKANALKVFINLIFTPFALAVFIYKGQIDIVAGLVLAAGNSIGAYFASKYAVSWGASFVRYVLVIVILGAGTKLLFFP
ncbi:MAG: sulfite exporter TauE/SafE family protein [Bacteroidetes bacterium]|nr:MAG: sulfite exporter TauE/SafE family protein [Bacteroidota bacterium]